MSHCTGFVLPAGERCKFTEQSCTTDHTNRIYTVSQITEMRTEITDLGVENAELKNGARFMQGVIDKMTDDAIIVAQTMSNEDQSTRRLNHANEDLRAENESLNNYVAQLQQQIGAHAAEQESFQQEISRLDKAQREMQHNSKSSNEAMCTENERLLAHVAELNHKQLSLADQLSHETNTLDAYKASHARLQAQLHEETDKHVKELQHSADVYSAEIAGLVKSQFEAQERAKTMEKEMNQILADNVTNLAELDQVRKEKSHLEERVVQLAAGSYLVINDKLDANQCGVHGSPEVCIDNQNQLRTMHDQLVATQKQLELALQSNNDLHRRIEVNEMVSDMEYVNVQSTPEVMIASVSNDQSHSQHTEEFVLLHNQLAFVEKERDDARRKLRAISSVLDDDYVECCSIQPRGTNNAALRNRYEKIESMLDAADAANESLELSNSSLRKLLLAILTDMGNSDS